MRRIALALALAAGLAGCGGGSQPAQHTYHTKYGVQAHSPTFGLPPKNPALRPKALAPSVAPTAQMLDTVSLASFDGLRPLVVAGYTSGHWPTFGQMLGHYPHVVAVIVWQSHFGVGGHRSCLDREPGDAPTSAVGLWALHEVSVHIEPCVYASLSEMPGVQAALRAALGPGWRSRVFLWDADWTFVYHLDAGYDATQWTDHYLNRNIDASAVTYAFAGIQPHRLPVCFRHRESRSACAAAKNAIAGYERAEASSSRAYSRRGCPALARRGAWFSRQLRLHPRSARAAYRRRALAATRRAERREGCSTFVGRERFYLSKIQAVRAAN